MSSPESREFVVIQVSSIILLQDSASSTLGSFAFAVSIVLDDVMSFVYICGHGQRHTTDNDVTDRQRVPSIDFQSANNTSSSETRFLF